MAEHHKDGAFYWSQLVWQEVWMYISLAVQVDWDEYEALCKRRGFDAMMREYLAAMLIHVGLGRKLTLNTNMRLEERSAAE
jgi:hypothetical protein